MNWLQALALTVDILVVLTLIGVTIAGRDVWPFSSYPMFSAYRIGQTYQRFFTLRFHFPDGRAVDLPPCLADLATAFHDEFASSWQGTTRTQTTDAVIARLWQRAAEREPTLGNACRLEVSLTIVQIGTRGGLSLAKRSVAFLDSPVGRR